MAYQVTLTNQRSYTASDKYLTVVYTNHENGNVTINKITGYKDSGAQNLSGTGTRKTLRIKGIDFDMGTKSIAGYSTSGIVWKKEIDNYQNENLDYSFACSGTQEIEIMFPTDVQYQTDVQAILNAKFKITVNGGYAAVAPTVAKPSATNITHNSISVSFTYNDGGATVTSTRMDLSTNPNMSPVAASINGTSGTFGSLLPATTYYIKAYATNSVGTGSSGVSYITTKVAPPTNATISNLDTKWVSMQKGNCITGTVSATPGAGTSSISNYKVYYKQSVAINYNVLDLGTNTTFEIPNLQDNTDYSIYCVATTSGGSATSQVYTQRTGVLTYAKVSVNGGAFTSRKIYFNQSDSEWYLAYNRNIHIERN